MLRTGPEGQAELLALEPPRDHRSADQETEDGMKPRPPKPSCSVCGWRMASRRGRCNSCRLFLMRHGRDRTVDEVVAGWNRTMDRLAMVLDE